MRRNGSTFLKESGEKNREATETNNGVHFIAEQQIEDRDFDQESSGFRWSDILPEDLKGNLDAAGNLLAGIKESAKEGAIAGIGIFNNAGQAITEASKQITKGIEEAQCCSAESSEKKMIQIYRQPAAITTKRGIYPTDFASNSKAAFDSNLVTAESAARMTFATQNNNRIRTRSSLRQEKPTTNTSEQEEIQISNPNTQKLYFVEAITAHDAEGDIADFSSVDTDLRRFDVASSEVRSQILGLENRPEEVITISNIPQSTIFGSERHVLDMIHSTTKEAGHDQDQSTTTKHLTNSTATKFSNLQGKQIS